MLRLSWMVLVFASCAVPVSAADDAETTLHLLTEENHPYSYTDTSSGEVTGTGVGIVREIMAQSGVSYSIQSLPWQRAYRRAQSNANTCVFITNRTPAREPLFQWVGPLLEGGWAVFKRPDSTAMIDTPKDLQRYTVVGKSGSASVDDIEEQAGIKVTRTVNDETAAKMLFHGRADFWVSGVIDAPLAAKAANLPAPALALLWKKADLSMACSKATDPDLIARLNAINSSLDALRKSILARHGGEVGKQN
ncbi:polar amino acid transport system substrate-binding protein [Kordiimonas lacus]|uniref:Polar amino acid transport system substrate-binding protein n=2 Tax=Kordiimonas lacus TaxID=637679 RepID=A0A1G6YVP4_9PROT|nr:polar amino acid transport system substrate-binding protein [Kordiimonas lacus]